AYGLFALGVSRWWHSFWRPAPRPERRRAIRTILQVPVFVYAWYEKETFWENTETLNVSVMGGLVPLSVPFATPRQTIAISNVRTNVFALCRVTRIETTLERIIVGFEFLKDEPAFW